MHFKFSPLQRSGLQMVFVIAAEEMPLKAKSADNIIASFLRIFVLKKKKKKKDICFGMPFH